MEEKILAFNNGEDRYRKLAEKSIAKGDYEGAFCFLFSALKDCKNPYEIYGDLADAYSETGQFEKAIEYWFKYLYYAPKDKASVAYEELSVNFFYLDKMFDAGYYFHKKIMTDGYASREGLGEEIAEVLSSSIGGREAYHIAYPFDRADYSHEKKLGKRALSSGDCGGCYNILDSIPIECMDEEAFGDKAVASFLQGEEENSLKACKESLKINGENITAYCNLCTYYYNKHDDEKSLFYYQKALSLFDKSLEQSYLLASCAIEQMDHGVVNDCLSKITADRKYDVMMRLYYGLSFINLGEYEKAERELSFALRLTPQDRVIKYYVDLSQKLVIGDEKAREVLPLKYQKEYPEKQEKKFRRIINELINEKKDISILKKEENLNALYYGIWCEDELLNKESAILFWFAKNIKGDKILTSLLLDNELRAGVKRVIIYTLILFGYKSRFGVIANNRLKIIKRAKMLFDDKTDGEVFNNAYAIATARTAFWEVDADKQLVKTFNNLYKKHKTEMEILSFSPEDIVVVALATCGNEYLSNGEQLASVFGVNYSKIKEMINICKGEKND